jgi:FlaA1/EpsC-like NDP-sugar epimerase
MWSIQLCAIPVSGILAFLLRFDLALPGDQWVNLAYAVPVWMVVKTVVFWLMRVHLTSWRHFSIADVTRISMANLAASSVSVIALSLIAPPGIPRSVYFLDLLLCVFATGGVRVLARIVTERARPVARGNSIKRVFIYGAGAAGISVVREIRNNPRLAYLVCGFIDDDERKRGLSIQKVRVLGCGRNLKAIKSKHAVDEILIAIPSATGSQMTQILRRCHEVRVRCKTIPGLTEIIEGSGLAAQIRDVAVEDLLGRTPVKLDESAIRGKVEGRVVLVTGAAGSIGSELCRQMARFEPTTIVGCEIAETALFHIQRQMKRAFPQVHFAAEIGSIQNKRRLAEVFDQHRPSMVFHAAAYKHVPMMEAHAVEAVENNVFGTLNVACAAAEHGVQDFVMISSDKAVHPTNVMGVTKRVAEIMIRSLQTRSYVTKFVSVRFGNVLGSNGSVVPIFKEQIARGGPVTVTHPEMQRYFMTIPEASQLVLQASTLGHGGEIFVLDMGQPVRIVDLARKLILLSGLQPDHDIEIEFTGTRPGEKLYEEINTLEEDAVPTCHEKIKVFAGATVPWSPLERQLEALRHACTVRDFNTLLLLLKDIVPEYNPSADILRRALKPMPHSHATAAASAGLLH